MRCTVILALLTVLAVCLLPLVSAPALALSATVAGPTPADTVAPTSIDGNPGVWPDVALTFTATRAPLDEAILEAVSAGAATVEETYSWCPPGGVTILAGGWPGNSDVITFKFLYTAPPGVYMTFFSWTVIVTYMGDPAPEPDYENLCIPVYMALKRPTVSLDSDKGSICAGGKDSPVHQATLIATVTDGWDNPLSGHGVSFGFDGDFVEVGPSFNPAGGTSDANGEVQTVLTSGDVVGSAPVYATCSPGQDPPIVGVNKVYGGPQFGEPSMEITLIDPDTEEPISGLIADGISRAKVILTETFNNEPVDQHSLDWEFLYTETDHTSPDYEGTGEDPYGAISAGSGPTDGNGQAYVIYTVGIDGGVVDFQAADTDVWEPF